MTATSPDTRTVRPVWKPRLAAVVAAVLANALLGALAPLVGIDMLIAPPGQPEGPVPLVAFVLFTTVFGLIGWGTFALAERVLGSRARLVWTIVAVVFTLVSFAPSMSVGGSAATEAVLLLSHVVVAAILIPVFWRTAADS
ncbi:DUF6069 family protein [Nocardiopsis sp. CT-R113]|uniref:DUF6069 family protein n=1 Tax=Nocardiopsis codii TaxID=3065942 RepID=A0ABU7KEW9_9ACTN|nr:DUF6069 family protein [Nocardiopsis sp. CT-R113]MEE2040791.1 DUF6069 family protein [Nocardiopsis sp. CT-R113]